MSLAAALLLAAPAGAGPAPPPQGRLDESTIWYVDDDATGFGTGAADDPFISVTYAVSRPEVADGDTVAVLPGSYLNESIQVDGLALTIVSTEGPGATTLYGPPPVFGRGTSVLFARGATTEVVLEGFRITGGTGSLEASGFVEFVGGGVSVIAGARVALRDCEFEGNYADRGGDVYARGAGIAIEDCAFLGPGCGAKGEAIYARDASLSATGCTFRDQRTGPVGAPQGGGAVLVEHTTATIAHSTFLRNGSALFGAHVWGRNSSLRIVSCELRGGTAFAGGGLAVLGGDLTMSDTLVEQNVAIASPGGGLFASGASVEISRCAFRTNVIQGQREGGAVALLASQLVASDSEFDGNVAHRGGAVDVGLSSDASFDGCRFCNNRAQVDGAAVLGAFEATRCVVAANEIGGPAGTPPNSAALSGYGVLERCTITGNTVGGSAVSGRFALHATIAWGNTPMDVVTSASVSRSIVGSYVAPKGQVAWTTSADPRLWSTAGPELLPDSPAIDALPLELGPDPDGSAAEIGADAYSVFDLAPGYDRDLGNVACAGAPNSTGESASLRAMGSLDRSMDRLVVAGDGFPPAAPAIVLASTATGVTPLPASTGPLCIALPLVRVTPEARFTRFDGTFAARVPVTQSPFGGGAGSTWTLQVWFRDVVGAARSGVSSARTVTLLP